MAIGVSGLNGTSRVTSRFRNCPDCNVINTTVPRHAVIAVTDAMKETDFVFPLFKELVSVERREAITGTVRVRLHTGTREQLGDEHVSRNPLVVDRIAIGPVVVTIPDIREKGNLTIIRIVEEGLVAEKRRLLNEEIRIRRVPVNERHQKTVMLRKQNVTIDHILAGDGSDPVLVTIFKVIRSERMNSEIIVAVFDTPAHAAAAVSDL